MEKLLKDDGGKMRWVHGFGEELGASHAGIYGWRVGVRRYGVESHFVVNNRWEGAGLQGEGVSLCATCAVPDTVFTLASSLDAVHAGFITGN